MQNAKVGLWIRIAAAVAMAIVVPLGWSRISFNVDILKLLPTNLRQVRGLSLFVEHFAQRGELLLTVESADASTSETAVNAIAAHLRTRPDLTKRVAEKAPWESQDQGTAQFLAWLLLNQDPAKAAALVEQLAPGKSQAVLEETLSDLADSMDPRELAMLSYDPFRFAKALDLSQLGGGDVRSEFTSKDGAFRVIYVESAQKLEGYRDAAPWLDKVRAHMATLPLPEGVKLGYTGDPAYVSEIALGMENDMKGSGVFSIVCIALLFWTAYRRFRPLLAVTGMLTLTFLVSLGIAGVIFDHLTAVSVGFAAILGGLTVDYGFIVWSEAHAERDPAKLRKRIWPSIAWAALTTSAAFLTLNASSMPGLSQLGNLVAIGVIIGAVLMVEVFAPIAVRWVRGASVHPHYENVMSSPRAQCWGGWITGTLCFVLLGVLCVAGFPSVETNTRALRPRHSPAHDALERLAARLGDERELVSLVVTGADEAQVAARFHELRPRLEKLKADGVLESYISPEHLWPTGAVQQQNLATLAALAPQMERLKSEAVAAGFKDEAAILMETIMNQWTQWHAEVKAFPFWPDSPASTWILRRTVRREPGKCVGLGLLRPVTGRERELVALDTGEVINGVYAASWKILGTYLAEVIPREFYRIAFLLVGIIAIMLFAAFRSWREPLIVAASLSLIALSLLGAMRLFGLSWNYLNLAAILILLGCGVDYSIHVLLALKRTGSVPAMQRAMSMVIVLCAASTVIGFGSTGFASNLGLASLGIVCAIGIALDAVITLFLVPLAWQALCQPYHKAAAPEATA